MTLRRLRMAFAAALAAAMVLVGVAFGAGSASAVESADDEQPILTIVKYTTPTHDEATGTGEDDPASNSEDSPNKPVEGVEYTVYRVKNINMATNAGQQQGAELQKKFAAAPSLDTVGMDNLEEVGKQVTAANGQAVFNLTDESYKFEDRGLYVVVESDASGAKVDGKPVQVSPAKPFVVAVPLTDPQQLDGLVWNVKVFPKNAPIYANKQVEDSSAYAVGDTVTFPVTTGIPQEADIDKYVVIDKFDPAHLEFKRVATVEIGETLLTPNTDYAVSNDAGLVKVTFTTDGLDKLRANAGKEVKTVFEANVLKVADSNGEISNTAYVAPSSEFGEDPDGPTPAGKRPPIPSNPVVLHYAKIVVNKKGENGAALAGAVFEVSRCDGDGLALNVGGATEFTTDDKGQATIDAVRVADFENGKQLEEPSVKYCLTETKAPAGYELLAEPVELDVTSANVTNGVYTVDVENVKHNTGFHLPKTGSSAAILLGVVGALLLAAGVVVTLRRRQRD